MSAFPAPVVATAGSTDPARRWSCCCTAAARTSARSSAWPTTCRPGPRTPPSARRSPRAAGTPGSPTAASAAPSPSRCARRWTGSAAGSTTSHPAGRPVVLVGFSGGAAFAGGLLLDDPPRYAGAAILYGTLPFDAGVPTTPGPAGRRARFRRAGRAGHRHPARAARPHLGLPARRVGRPDHRPPRPGRPRHRPRRRSAPSAAGSPSGWPSSPAAAGAAAGPDDLADLPDGVLPARAGARPGSPPHIPQEQRSDNAPASCRSGCSTRSLRCRA